jgi:DNA-binding response OmpR family regulator
MPQKILVIDDEQLIRWTLVQHLAKEEYDVMTADSAEKGLASINGETPDLLPEMTGLELLETLNAPERLKGLLM